MVTLDLTQLEKLFTPPPRVLLLVRKSVRAPLLRNPVLKWARLIIRPYVTGMDASLQINPYYGKTSSAGILQHFQAVMDFGPAIVYNVPARTSQDISPDIMQLLAKHENFAGVKECEGNDRIRAYTDDGIVCWTGNDDEAHAARYEAGAVGGNICNKQRRPWLDE